MNLKRRSFMLGILAEGCYPAICGASPLEPKDSTPFEIVCSLGNRSAVGPVRNIRTPQPQAARVIHWITDLVGLRASFELREADFDQENVAIAVMGGQQRFIIYDAKWFSFEPNAIGWYSVWILGHEIGHHLYGHTHGFKPDQHRGELDADRFGGWVVARLGGASGSGAFLYEIPAGNR